MKEFFLNYLLIFSTLLFTISFVGLVFFFVPLFVEKYFIGIILRLFTIIFYSNNVNVIMWV